MRTLARALRHARYFSRLGGGRLAPNGPRNNQKVLLLSDPAACSLHSLSRDREIGPRLNPIAAISRALSTPATNKSTAVVDVGSAGPLLEYERRIASGELLDGDSFQIDTLQVLQRLYDQLVELEDVCQLDRYKASEKAGRSRWLWSRLIPQSSYSPVKGLYLYGGVGTGKTMLMDLFYGQLYV